MYKHHMLGDKFHTTSTPELIGEVLERAAAQGREQNDAFRTGESVARAAVRAMVTIFLENGCHPDGIGTGSYSGEDGRYWVLRRYAGQSKKGRYGGGSLLDANYGRSVRFYRIVADSRGSLTAGESHLNTGAPVRLIEPSRGRGIVFNVDALLASPALCDTVLEEVIQDVAATTTRVFSGRRS